MTLYYIYIYILSFSNIAVKLQPRSWVRTQLGAGTMCRYDRTIILGTTSIVCTMTLGTMKDTIQ